MGLVSTPVSYNSGQVIVSTGKYDAAEEVSTGYILLNANPNDPSTPYMDIVERTGSGVYDLQLRSRLGDLSGLSSAYLYGDDEPGFGLYTENGFFKGSITADTGSIAGILNVATTQGGLETGQKITIGRNIGNTKRLDTQASQTGQHDGFRINENNYWLTTAEFRIGNDNNYLHISGTEASQASQFKINTKELEVKVDGTNGRSLHDLEISSAETSMSFSDKELVLKAGTYGGTNAGFIQVGDNRAIEITGSNNLGVIRSTKTNFGDDTPGFWLANDNGTIEFYIGDATEHLKFDGSDISLAGDNISLTADNVDVTTGTFEVDADDFQLSSTRISASFGYDTNADSGITIKGGDPSYIYFGSKTTPPLKLVSDDQAGVNEHYLATNNRTFALGTGIIIGSDAGTSKLQIGGLTSALASQTQRGLYFDGNGDFIIKSSTNANKDYIRGVAGSLLINSTDFELTAGSPGSGQLKIDKTTIALGSTLPTSRTSGNGFFVNNSGEVLLGDADNKRLEFDGADLVIYGSDNDKIVIDGTGVDIYEGGTTSAAIAFSIDTGTVTIGKPAQPQTIINGTSLTLKDSSDVDRVVIGTNDVDFYDEQGYNVMNIDTGVVTIGKGNATSITTEEHIIIDGTGLTVKDGATTRATFAATSVIGSSTNKVTISDIGITIRENNKDVISMASDVVTIGSSTDQVEINGTSGITIRENNVDVITLAGGVVDIGNTAAEHIEIDGSGMKVKDNTTTRATFAATSIIGSSTDKVTISDGNITLRANNVDEFKVTDGQVDIGNTGGAQIIIDTVGGTSGIQVKDRDNAEIVFIGESAAIAGRTSAGSPLPTTDAVRGIVTDGLTANRAIITGSITAETFIGSTLDITGSANVGGLVTSGSVRNTSTGAATSVMIHVADNSNTYFQVLNDGEVLARDNITAFTTGFTSISDKRLKENVYPISDSLNKIVKLEPSHFTWIEKQEQDIGFIAQEVEDIIPEVIHETKGFVDINSDKQDDTTYKSISYDKLTVYLVGAIKELTKRIEDLEKRVK